MAGQAGGEGLRESVPMRERETHLAVEQEGNVVALLC